MTEVLQWPNVSMHCDGFFAGRVDRLGARLNPLTSAFSLADQLGKPFCFQWREGGKGRMESPESLFCAEVNQQRIREEITSAPVLRQRVRTGISESHNEIARADLESSGLKVLADPFGHYLVEGSDPQAARQMIADSFANSILLPRLREFWFSIRDKMPSSFTAIHLRRGDILEQAGQDPKKMFERFLPQTIVERFVDEPGRIVVFTDAPRAELTGAWPTFASLRLFDGLNLTPNQQDLLELLLMGGAERIIGGRSAFSSAALVLGGRADGIRHPFELLPPGEYAAALLDDAWDESSLAHACEALGFGAQFLWRKADALGLAQLAEVVIERSNGRHGQEILARAAQVKRRKARLVREANQIALQNGGTKVPAGS